MKGIASLLDPTATGRVKEVWHELEDRCGLVGIKITPIPHFSWQVTEDYASEELDLTLSEIARRTCPFLVHTAGLGIFSGEHPIVYIPVIKTRQLIQLHETLWTALAAFAKQPSGYYAPGMWVPHITLAYGDVDKTKLSCALQTLVSQSFDWEIRIENLTVIALHENASRDLVQYPLTG
jgi:2'-5' RNA ligase